MENSLTFSQPEAKKNDNRMRRSVAMYNLSQTDSPNEAEANSGMRPPLLKMAETRNRNTSNLSKNEKIPVAKKRKDLSKLKNFFLLKHKKRENKLKRKCVVEPISQKKPKIFKNRYLIKTKFKPKKSKVKSLEKRNQTKRRTSRAQSHVSKMQNSDFMLSSIFFPEKNVSTKKPKPKKSQHLNSRLNENYLLQKGFNKSKNNKTQNSFLLQKLTFSKISLNKFLLYNFISIQSIKKSFCDFKLISNGRLCLTSSAKKRFSSERVLIKSYEISFIKSPPHLEQFLVPAPIF